jgi:hypothetical protein
MTSERDLLLSSLPPEEGADWEEFESAFLRKKPGCPLTGDLIELAQGQDLPEVAGHVAGCDGCRALVEAYRCGWEEKGGDPPAPTGSLLETFADGFESAPPVAPRPSDSAAMGPNSVVLTGIFTMLLAGRTEEALRLLQPYLPDVLAAVGLDPALSDQLGLFLRQRLRAQPRSAPAPCPEWLRDFAREVLHFDELPCQPAPQEWRPVIARCALRTVQSSAEETPQVRQLLTAAVERGVTNPAYLDRLRLSAEPAGAVTAEECRRVIRKVRREEDRVARLFGLD